jgi:signal transduction histidine kinase
MSDLKEATAKRLAATVRRLRRRVDALASENEKLCAAAEASETHRLDFEANLSHELMTPITAIKGYSQSLAGGALKIPGRGLQFAVIIEQHAERLALVVEDILRLSCYESAKSRKLRPIDLRRRILKELTAARSAAARRGLELTVEVPQNMKVLFDRDDLSRILKHLFANAIKYNRPNGTIAIAARRAGRRAVVTIRDTGIGVPAGDLPRIFDRFHRAENARARTERAPGLGLALVRSMLLSGGCRIWAESTEGQGTTIFFTLPIARSR